MAERAIVLANGDINLEIISARLASWGGALVIGADGGSRHAQRLGLRVDAVIGDMDSIDDHLWESLEVTGAAFEVVHSHKDETDLELALMYAVRRGATHIACIGASGDRLDMTIANAFLLLHPALNGVRVEVWAGKQTLWLMRPPGETVQGKIGDTLSLIPLLGAVLGITTHGLEYALKSGALIPGPARGVSNVFIADQARIDFQRGALLAVHTPGRA